MAEIALALGSMIAETTATVAPVIGAVAPYLGAAGTIYAGISQSNQAQAQADAMQKKGDAEFASSQRDALEKKRQTDMVLSRERAVAASSGAGATDASVEAVMGKTQQQGDYSAQIDMYNGAINRADLYTSANNTRSNGNASFLSSLFGAGSSIYSDWWRKSMLTQGYDIPRSVG